MARPEFHLTPPRGWMNDPCAPYQDASGVFHCFYQWVPNSTEWSHEIGWGHAWSHDGTVWETETEPVLMPGPKGSYDEMGVFTGGLWPGSQNSEQSIVVYSAINNLVNKFAGYVNGQERLGLARFMDNGRSFTKNQHILDVHPPPNVTGWRDPYLSPWESMDRLRSSSRGMYAIIAGGIKGVGPTLFLYQLPQAGTPLDRVLGKWDYLGPLIAPGRRPNPPPSRWLGDLGDNWECPSFFTIGDSEFVIVGSEGKWSDTLTYQNSKVPSWQLWFSGKLCLTADGPQFERTSEGIVDWGNYYAAQTFKSNDGRTLNVGWLVDNDLDDAGRRKQGWAGAMSCLREVFLQEVNNVIGSIHDKINITEYPPFEVCESASSRTVRTLGIKPVDELSNRRSEHVDLSSGPSKSMIAFDVQLSAEIGPQTAFIGLELMFQQGCARVQFLPAQERIVVLRAGTWLEHCINTDTEYGMHTLFRKTDGDERLELRVIFDHGITEIFANDRFALSTRLYGGPCRAWTLSS